LPEWLFEEGIGENRAVLVEDGSILEAAIELPDDVRVSSVIAGRLRDITVPRQRGWVTTSRGDVLVQPIPTGLTKGASVRVLITREQILERGAPKSLIGRITDEPEREGPSLSECMKDCIRVTPHDPDRLGAAGWDDVIGEAVSGDIPFTGGELRLSLTPAMSLFDVDGVLPLDELVIAGAAAAGRAIRRHGIGGSIGIDLPTVQSKDVRRRAAEAIDAVLPQPFERTAVNGFGFLQIVRKRERQSIPERVQFDPIGAAARAVLRKAERVPGSGARRLITSPPVQRYLESRSEWLDALRRRIGTEVVLQAQPSFTTWGFHVQSAQS
jgi:hypothetical protein